MDADESRVAEIAGLFETNGGGKLTNQQGALHTVARQPFGKLLLTLMAIGFGGCALWWPVRAAPKQAGRV